MEWRIITDERFSLIYEVSNMGDVRKNERILKQHKRSGYLSVSLYCDVKKRGINVVVHRLVALAFIENPLNLPYVNHKDGNRCNNNIDNLEWVSASENCKHAFKNGLHIHFQRAVNKLSLKGDFIEKYESVNEAGNKNNLCSATITKVCKKKKKDYGGFLWEYVIPDEIIIDVQGKEIEGYPNYIITIDCEVYSKKSKKILKPKILASGHKCIKIRNNGIIKEILLQKLYREYYPNENVLCPKSN